MMAHKQNYCSSPNFCLAFLSLFLLMRHTCTYGYNIGTEVILDFHHELTSQVSSYLCIASLEGPTGPFFYENQTIPGGLRPGQAGRVDVIIEQSQRNVTIHITIHELQRVDEGLYVVNVAEAIDGTLTPHFYESYVHATYPPGKAACQIKNPPIQTKNWLVVRCYATLGNDDGGYLMCFQNSQQVPYLQPVRHVAHNVTADFWMDPMTEIQCCSTYNASDINLDSCDDFVNTPPPDGSLTSYRPDHNTPKAGKPTSPSSIDDGSPPDHANTSQQNVATVIMAVTFPVIFILVAVVILVFWLRKGRFHGQQPQQKPQSLAPTIKYDNYKPTLQRGENGECSLVDEKEMQKMISV